MYFSVINWISYVADNKVFMKCELEMMWEVVVITQYLSRGRGEECQSEQPVRGSGFESRTSEYKAEILITNQGFGI